MKISPAPVLDASSKISHGGFGSIFVDPRDKNTCIKIFNTPLSGESAETLLSLTAIRSWARPSDAELLTSRFAWPIDVFGENGLIHGYSMPLAPQTCYFDLTVVRKETRQPLQLKYLFDGPYWQSAAIRSTKPEASVQDRIEMAIDAVDSVNALHSYGLSYGDVSGNNIVARLADEPGVFFFDVDSIAPTELRSQSPLRSPGWETPEDLGPQEIDRSRLAILIVRLLSEDLNAWPDRDSPSLLEPSSAKVLAKNLGHCYEKGDSRSFQQLTSTLRSLRSSDRSRRAVDAARRSGFARRVVLEAGGARTNDMTQLRATAEEQVQIERALEETRGFERRRMERRLNVVNSSFRLDVLPITATLTPLRTLEELRELIFEACFDEIGLQFSTRGLGALENSSIASRAIERALIEVGPENLVVQPGQGEASLSFQWPGSALVNTAELTISIGQDRQRHLLSRSDEGSLFRQVLRVPKGGRGRASLTLCAQSPSGTRVQSPLSMETEFRIPPNPTPVSPRPTPQSRPSRVVVPPSAYHLVDLEAEERERLAALAYRRRRKRKQLLLAGTSTLVLAGTAATFLLWGRETPESPQATIGIDDSIAGIIARDSVLYIETTTLGIVADEAMLYISSNGVKWVWVEKVALQETLTTVDLSNLPANFYKIEFLSSGEFLSPGYVVSDLYEGLSEVPGLILDENSVRAEWVRANPAPSGQIEKFNYRFSRTSKPELIERVYETTIDATPSIYLPAGETGFKLEIQVVYSDDRTGPWIVVGRT
jgi:hypothetical protein